MRHISFSFDCLEDNSWVNRDQIKLEYSLSIERKGEIDRNCDPTL